jgi:hypothetical protein
LHDARTVERGDGQDVREREKLNGTPVGKPSSSRDSQPDDLDTVLVVSSDEIKRAREQVESVTSETATIDCHPVILDDSEEETDRFVDDASRSGMVAKNPLKARVPGPAPEPLPTMIDEEEIEISESGIISEAEQTPTHEAIVGALAAVEVEERSAMVVGPPDGKSEPRATITEVREVEPILPKEIEKGLAEAGNQKHETDPRPSASGDDTTTEQRPKLRKADRFDDETMPMPKPNLVDIGGAMETVPLHAALVQNVLAQVDARAAARAAGEPVPQFQLPTGPPLQPPPPHVTPRQPVPAPSPGLQPQGAPIQPPATPQRRLGIEVLITVLAFLFVAVPALYYLYLSFTQ